MHCIGYSACILDIGRVTQMEKECTDVGKQSENIVLSILYQQSEMEVKQFSAVDYVVFVGTLVVSMAIGIYHAWKGQKTNKQFLMANRNLPAIPLAMSLLVSYMSAIMTLALSGEIYAYGTQIYVAQLGHLVVLAITAEVFIPIFYPLKITSVYEYLERRYKHRAPRVCSSLLFVFQTVLFLSIVLYAPTIALSSVTTLSWWVSILLLGVICTIYTTVGGMKAVVWTDVVQMLVMFTGLVSMLVLGFMKVGGIARAWEIASQGGRIQFFNFSFDPYTRHTVWTVIFGWFINACSIYSCSQIQVQRYLSSKSLRSAKAAAYLTYPANFVMNCMNMLLGVVVFAFYAGCDPITTGIIKKKDAILPLFVMDQLSHLSGLPGIFVACLFSGALSSLSSGLNSLAAVTWEECKQQKTLATFSEEKAARITKMFALFYGLLVVALAFAANSLPSLIQTMGVVWGASSGPIFGSFVVSIIVPFTNTKGFLAGMSSGFLVAVWKSVGGMLYVPDPLTLPMSIANCTDMGLDMSNFTVAGVPVNTTTVFRHGAQLDEKSGVSDFFLLSYLMISILGFITTFVVAVAVSLATGGNVLEEADEKYIHPLGLKVHEMCRWGKKEKRDRKTKDKLHSIVFMKVKPFNSAEKEDKQ